MPLSLPFTQHHKKIRLGHASKWECLLRSNAEDLVDADGELEDDALMTTTKIPGEGRGGSWGGVRRRQDGGLETGEMPPKNYSGMQGVAPQEVGAGGGGRVGAPDKGGKDRKPLGWPWTAKKEEGGQFLGYEGRLPDPVKRMRELRREPKREPNKMGGRT